MPLQLGTLSASKFYVGASPVSAAYLGSMLVYTAGSAFSPPQFFAAGEQGAWFDPSDFATLFQDAAGTVPVTAVGQPVGRILDKSGRGNHATQPTAAARPTLQLDGSKHYLQFDGTDDFLVTGVITPNTDKAQVFTGLRRAISGSGIVCEFSENWAATGRGFSLSAGAGGADPFYFSGCKTTVGASLSQGGSWPTVQSVPDIAVISATHDVAADRSTLRRNGVAGTIGTGDKGTGNLSPHALYIGARGGSSLRFNGRIYSLIARFGPNLTNEQITQAETWVNSKTGAF